MQQSYHAGGDFDAFHPTSHRIHYDRATPYGYYEPRHELRQDYAGRIPTHTSIQEPDEPLTASGQARRRIAVACGRCRRRKIKCSGDPGDGTGCQACRSSGVKVEDCNFCRVNSETLEVMTSLHDVGSTRQYNIDASSSAMINTTASFSNQHRPSLPVLQTRGTWPTEFDNQYESSPVDAYTYATASGSRNDSMASAYGPHEGYRTCGTSAPLSAPVSTPYYETGTYSFGSLQSPVPGFIGGARLPSVSTEAMSPLNMGSLHSSLPSHTPLERRLPPVAPPYSISFHQRQPCSHALPEPPAVNPETANFRPYINGVHSRHAMPWSVESNGARRGTTGMQSPSYATTSPSQHQITGALPISTAPITDSVLGYQFHPPPSSYSPDSSPPVVPTLGEPFPSTAATAMLPPAHPTSQRYTAASIQLPAIQAPLDDARPSSSRLPEIHAPASMASLYSYSSETSDRSSSDATARDQSGHDESSPNTEASASDPAYHGYHHSRHIAHPQHSASYDGLRRQSEYDTQRTTAGAGHRISMRSLNDRC